MRSWRTRSVDETLRLGESLASELLPDGLLLLVGDMGSGKTVLTRGIARGLGIESDEVQSPTFVLMREHVGPLSRLVHIDLYRLDASQVGVLGLEELFDQPGIKVIEWADRLPGLPSADLVLELNREGAADSRTIRELPSAAISQSGVGG